MPRTLRSSFRELAGSIRGMAAAFGVRPYRVYMEVVTWDGSERGQGTSSATTTELTEGPDANPPKVVFGDGFDISGLGGDSDEVTVGPITPDWVDEDGVTVLGGVELSAIHPDPADNSTVRVKLVGPDFPNGAYFRIADTDHHRGYQLKLKLKRIGEGQLQ